MTLNGIDVSNWQKGINLAVVPADFVIMKATEGTGYVSADCNRQYQQAKQAGRLLGVYHYANGGDVKAEADHFLKNVKGYIGEAILVLDWESGGNRTWAKSNEKAWVKQWCDYVASKTGVNPLVYVQASALNRLKGIGNYALWVAQYANSLPTGYQAHPWNEGKYVCAIRQYSSTGRLAGYNGNLDLNIAYMDRATWKKYAGSTTKTPATPKPTSPEGTTLNLAVSVMEGRYGNGETRKKALGARYNEVQDFIDHIAKASVSTLVAEVKAGKYGNGAIRKTVLGSRYDEVQKAVNGTAANQPKAVYYTVKSGDTVTSIATKYGTTVATITKLNGLKDANKIYPGQKLRVK